MDMDNKNHKGFKIFLIVLIIGILFFTNKDNRVKFIEAFQSLNTKDKVLELVEGIQINDADDVFLHGDKIIKWNHNIISFLNLDGSINLEKELSFENPHIIIGTNIYLMDKNTGDIYILDDQGQTINRLELKENIINIREENNRLLINTKSEEMENLWILDMNGEVITKHNIDNMNLLNYGISRDGEQYIISYLNLEEDLLKSQIFIHSIDGTELFKLDIDEEIILYNQFIKDGIIVLTETNLYLIKDREIQWKRPFKSIKDIELMEEEFWLLYDTNLEVVDLKGRTKNKLNVDENFNGIIPFEKYILVYGEEQIWGINRDRVFMKEDIGNIQNIYINDSTIGIYGNNILKLYKLNDK